eukprot:568300-Pyramimonas_sp.AAC.1
MLCALRQFTDAGASCYPPVAVLHDGGDNPPHEQRCDALCVRVPACATSLKAPQGISLWPPGEPSLLDNTFRGRSSTV